MPDEPNDGLELDSAPAIQADIEALDDASPNPLEQAAEAVIETPVQPTQPAEEPISRAEYEWYQRRAQELEAQVAAMRSGQSGQQIKEPAKTTNSADDDPAWKRMQDMLREAVSPIQARLEEQERIARESFARAQTPLIVSQADTMVEQWNAVMPGIKEYPSFGPALKQIVGKAIQQARDTNPNYIPNVQDIKSFYRQNLDLLMQGASAAGAKKAIAAVQGAAGAKIATVKGGTAPAPAAKKKEIDYDNYEDVEVIRKHKG